METPRESHSESADLLAENGYSLVALREGTKIPCFKGWQQDEMDAARRWQLFDGTDLNVGIRTGGKLIVVDIDSPEQEDTQWVLDKVGNSPMQVITPSGGRHVYLRTRGGVEYQNKIKVRGKPYDIIYRGRFIVCPWSKVEGIAYRWAGPILPVDELPIIKITPLRERKRRPKPIETPSGIVHRTADSARKIANPAAYVMRIESVQGQNGSAALVRVVCILRDAGWSPQQAFDFIMGTWNPACARPEWSGKEVMHAIERHFGAR